MFSYQKQIDSGVQPSVLPNEVIDAVLNGSALPRHDAIVNGVIRTLQDLPPDTGLRIDRRLSADARRQQQNRAFCLPLLREVLDGSPPARMEYERRRLSLTQCAPNYVQNEIADTYARVVSELKPGKIIPSDEPVITRSAFKIWLKENSEKASWERVALDMAPTYDIARSIIEILQARPAREMVEIVPTLDGRRRWNAALLPTSPDPLGRAALKVWDIGSTLLLKANILEDLLLEIGLDVPSDSKLKTLRFVKNPWDICESPLIRNASQLVRGIESGTISGELADAVMRKPERLLLPNFDDIVSDIRIAIEDKRRRKAAAAELSGPIVETSISTPQVTSKDEFFSALAGAAPVETNFNQFSQDNRAVYGLYKKGIVSMAEALDLVREGRTAADFLKSRRVEKQSDAVSRTGYLRRLAGKLFSPAEPVVVAPERYTIDGTESKWFQDWLGRISAPEQNLVKKRLDGAVDGFFGSYTPLREDRRLFEFRFGVGNGKRLIFCFPVEKVILLLGASNKDEQDRLVKCLAKELDEKLAQWHKEHPNAS